MVKNFNWDLLSKDLKYIVGVSGGPDSMFLLSFLTRHEWEQNIIVCHVNYKKRSQSDLEALYVKEYCQKNNILFFQKEVVKEDYFDHKNHNFQHQARSIRYDFFYKIAKQHQINNILIAHNQNDLIETFLMQEKKGVLASYYGLPEKRKINNKFVIIRPMLKLSRDVIEEYLKLHHIRFFIDHTNLTDDYTRNIVRKKIANNYFNKEEVFRRIAEKNFEIKKTQKYFLNIQNKTTFPISIYQTLTDDQKQIIIWKLIKNNESSLLRKKSRFLKEAVKQLNQKKKHAIFFINNKFYLKKTSESIIFGSKSYK